SNLAFFNERETVASHAGHDLFVGVHFADIPEAGDEKAAVGGSDHFIKGRVASGEDKIHGSFAILVGESEAVAGGLFTGGFGGGAGIDEVFGDAAINQLDTLAGEAFAVEGRALLERMIRVV